MAIVVDSVCGVDRRGVRTIDDTDGDGNVCTRIVCSSISVVHAGRRLLWRDSNDGAKKPFVPTVGVAVMCSYEHRG